MQCTGCVAVETHSLRRHEFGVRPILERDLHMLKNLQASREWDDKNLAQKGFTLVELLVVIVILGILAAVVVFAVSGIQDRGNNSACGTDASTVRTAVEAYRSQGQNFAANPTMAQLVTAGLLSKASTLVAITYGAGAPASYTINGVAGTACNGMANL